MEGKQKNRRRTLIVNKKVQTRMVLTLTFVPILGLIAATLAVGLLTGQVLEEARQAEVTLPTLGPLFIALFSFILAAGVVVVIQALRYSHRIAGPTFRIVRSLKDIRSGNLGFRVKLRKGDELEEIADELNRLIDWLAEHPPKGVEIFGAKKQASPVVEDAEDLERELAAMKEE